MIKKWLLEKGLKFLLISIVIGMGIWYLSSALGGASLSYTSTSNFLKQIGVQDGDISNANGCFLCIYISKLFEVLGEATNLFWTKLVEHLWILMLVGFGIFLTMHTIQYMRENAASKDIKDLTGKEPKLEFGKWFEKVWKTGARVLIAGAFIGAINWTGTDALKATTNLIVSPVMYIGTTLSLTATGLISDAECEITETAESDKDILKPVLKPFMCVMGNLNTVILAGAGGGFALMNYAWLGRGGGLFTWIAGLTLVIIFLIIGFDLLFQVLNVLFKLIFIIIFMPLLIASAAFEQVWGIAKNIMNSAIDILIKSAISILKICLKITIIYTIVFVSADTFFPGPQDNFTSILPPFGNKILPEEAQNMSAETMSVMHVFTECENASLENGQMDKDKFLECFDTQRAIVEARYPHAFDFMGDGFEFFIYMLGVFFLYFWVISPKIDALLNSTKEEKETFNYGDWLKDNAKTVYNMPIKAYDKIYDKIQKSKGS